jgi:poly(3-hydroxybutyrate) depolymerase
MFNHEINSPNRPNRTMPFPVFQRLALVFVGLLLTEGLAADAKPKAKAPQPKPTLKVWPAEVREIRYHSAADDSKQPAKYYDSGSKKKRPLLVALHTWSGDYRQKTSVPYAKWCIEHDWIMIHPNFRGSNTRPEAMGSELAVADILSAVDYAKANAAVDESRIYLVGASGGGYASLLMAGRAPEIWAGVSAWVPINDLQAWYFETRERKLGYADHIVKATGGVPEDGTAAAEHCRLRSAATYLKKARGVRLDINAGIHDGYTGSVPVSHALNAFNLVARKPDRLSDEQVEYFTKQRNVPDALQSEVEMDWTYGAKKVLFRRQSGAARVTIFEGGHEIIHEAALKWLAKQGKAGSGKK